MVVDCRSLIEFCKAFENYRSMANSLSLTYHGKHSSDSSLHVRSSQRKHLNGPVIHPFSSGSSSSSRPLCEKSSAAAVDIVILVLVLVACGFLCISYFKYVSREVAEVFPLTLIIIGEVAYQTPVAYISGAVLTLILVFLFWKLVQYNARKCDNPKCRGLRKAVEFDIQLESEKCVKSMLSSSTPPASSSFLHEVPWKGSVEFGHDHKELEAELKRMAPPNGRGILVFRSPCGCPAARMEVWGAKKPRKSKK